jgi:hypothetical protein
MTDKAEEYEEARAEAFNDEFREFIREIINSPQYKLITENDIQGFLDTFEFPDESDWLASQYESHLGECADQAYLEYKERDI